MALNDSAEKRSWALRLLRNAPVDSDAFDAACEYLHYLFINSAEAVI